jgi:hypothetical protein
MFIRNIRLRYSDLGMQLTSYLHLMQRKQEIIEHKICLEKCFSGR